MEEGKKERPRDLLWDELVRVCGATPSEMTKSERGRYNKALKELRDAGATPEQIRARAGQYRAKWPGIDLTPTALAANWSTLKPAPSPYRKPDETPHEYDEYKDMPPEVRAENRRRFHELVQTLGAMPDE